MRLPAGVPTEAQEHERVILWWQLYAPHQQLSPHLLWHCPNGGRRDAAEAAHFARLGVVAGVPDLFLAVARRGHHGMFVEMKRRLARHRASDAQLEQIALLREQGYYAVVCHGADEAIEAISDYLEVE